MKKVNWLVVGIVSVVVIFLLFGGCMMGSWGYRGWGMMGSGVMDGWGFAPFGWIGMVFMLLVSIGFIVLTVLGITWLVQNVGNSMPPSSQSHCPNCGKGAQADWQNCPYCGATLK